MTSVISSAVACKIVHEGLTVDFRKVSGLSLFGRSQGAWEKQQHFLAAKLSAAGGSQVHLVDSGGRLQALSNDPTPTSLESSDVLSMLAML